MHGEECDMANEIVFAVNLHKERFNASTQTAACEQVWWINVKGCLLGKKKNISLKKIKKYEQVSISDHLL